MNKLFNQFMIILIVLGPGLYFGYLGNEVTMGLAITGGAITVCLLNIDKFKSVKGGGFEAEMRDIVNKANATLSDLQEIASGVAETSSYTLAENQFYGNFSFEKRLEIHDKLVEKLKRIELSKEKLKEVTEVWNKGICNSYHNEINILAESKKENKAEKNNLSKEFNKLIDFKNLKIAEASKYKDLIYSLEINDDELNLLIQEFEEFQKTLVFNKNGKLMELKKNT